MPELAINTAALTQQISEAVSVPEVKEIQRLKHKCLLTAASEVSKSLQATAVFKPTPDPSLSAACSPTFPFISLRRQRHPPLASHCLTNSKSKGRRSSTTELD